MLQLRSSDSILPKAYGFLKIYKENTSLRTIVFSVNTIFYPIAKYLNKIISNNIPHTEFQVRNSFELCDALSNKIIPESCMLYLMSFRYLQISHWIWLSIALPKDGNILRKRFIKITKCEFMAAINFILSSTYFKFNNKIYKPLESLWNLLYQLL